MVPALVRSANGEHVEAGEGRSTSVTAGCSSSASVELRVTASVRSSEAPSGRIGDDDDVALVLGRPSAAGTRLNSADDRDQHRRRTARARAPPWRSRKRTPPT